MKCDNFGYSHLELAHKKFSGVVLLKKVGPLQHSLWGSKLCSYASAVCYSVTDVLKFPNQARAPTRKEMMSVAVIPNSSGLKKYVYLPRLRFYDFAENDLVK